jgi:hypothetical protein
MHRRRIESALLAGLAVVVAGMAAATLGTTTTREPASGSGGGPVGSGGGGGGSAASDVAATTDPLPVFTVLGVLAVVVLVVLAVKLPRETLWEVLRMLAMAALVVGLLWAFFTTFGVGQFPEPSASDVPLRGAGDEGGAPGPGGSEGGAPLPAPTAVGLVAAVLLAVGLVAVALRQADGVLEDGDDETGDEDTLAAVGRSAGRAADRIEDLGAPVDNQVYAAWKEMTGHLDVEDHGARTPGEFREAARAAGMDAADVDALTDVFESVRYGGATPTDERETRATDALRRIEQRYAREDDA